MKWKNRILISVTAIFTLFMYTGQVVAQEQQQELPEYWQEDWNMKPTPPRGADEGGGPYNRLVIWGAMVIDGTGGPPDGPTNIVIEGNRIVEITGGNPEERPDADRVIDARGLYVTPGFIDVHEHIGGGKIDYNASYAYKLWLAHGITAVKGVGFGDLEWSLKQQELSAANEIVAPRMIVCDSPGAGDEWEDREINTPEDMVEYVHYAKEKGIQCFGEIGALDPEMAEALFTTANEVGIQTMDHLDQMGVVRMTVADAVKLGVDEITHYYGLMESLLDEHTIQDWPINYNYSNEYNRFSRVARLWSQSVEPGSEKWQDFINLLLSNETILSPTFSIYLAGRNVMSARNAYWHEEYTLPSLWKSFQPNPEVHGSYFWNWTSADEAMWQNFYNKWMKLVYDYNLAGGRIAAGADDSFIYQVYGFGFIQELKLLQEAGLTPFEVLRSATLYGAESIFEPNEPTGEPIKYGIIREGLLADLLVLTVNPLKDFNLLYGTGTVRLNEETGEVYRVRALKYTIKDGIVYDAGELLQDVRQMVDSAEQRTGEEVDISPALDVALAPPDPESIGRIPVID